MANKLRFTEPEELELLENTIQLVMKGAMSYRVGAERMRHNTGKKFSHEGLRKMVNKRKLDDESNRAGLGGQSPRLSD